eukprot:6761313-Ditylum_brightwellii.AAC.1
MGNDLLSEEGSARCVVKLSKCSGQPAFPLWFQVLSIWGRRPFSVESLVDKLHMILPTIAPFAWLKL